MRSSTGQPRPSLPPPTEEEQKAARERAAAGAGSEGGLGGGLNNNGRDRALHLPEELKTNTGPVPAGESARTRPESIIRLRVFDRIVLDRVASQQLSLPLKCPGAGSCCRPVLMTTALLPSMEISQFTPAEQAAFAFTRKLTDEPYLIGDDDIGGSRLITTTPRCSRSYRSCRGTTRPIGGPTCWAFRKRTNRSPQHPHSREVSPLVTTVAPVDPSKPKGTSAPAAMAQRLPLEFQAAATSKLLLALPEAYTADPSGRRAAAPCSRMIIRPERCRSGCLMLDNAKAGRGIGGELPDPGGERTLELPKCGRKWPGSLRATIAPGMLGQARQRLRTLGQTIPRSLRLDNPTEGFTPAEQQVLKFTRKLTVAPQLIVDSDISRLREHFSDSEVAEVVHRVTTAAYFDRLTESAGLQLEN